MTTPKSASSDTFLARFERLDDATSITDDEATAVLADLGVDPNESLKRLFSKLDQVAAKERAERFAQADVARRRDLDRLNSAHAEKGRSELLTQLSTFRSSHPKLSAHFRNFESMSEEELRDLLVEIEVLVSSDAKK